MRINRSGLLTSGGNPKDSMPAENLRVPALVEDILLKILCSCDIATVLTCSLASRTLYSLSTSKHVWLALLSDLHRRGFIDLLPKQRLEDLSTHELLSLAKRTVRAGPKTWSMLDGRPAVVAREIILKPNIRIGDGILTWENEPQLLPGGKFILFQHLGNFECRSTADDRLIWEYKPSWRLANVQRRWLTTDKVSLYYLGSAHTRPHARTTSR
ncbi:hypothetical protein FPV67DRAFT_632665 [Lyophyllum atratum]|nr:hypothetical protein FPV67DRAFT_632665 [Lyophyllum atratum]